MSNLVADAGIPQETQNQKTLPPLTSSCTSANSLIPMGLASLPVPDHLRQFVLSNYPVDRDSAMFVCGDEPQRFALHFMVQDSCGFRIRLLSGKLAIECVWISLRFVIACMLLQKILARHFQTRSAEEVGADGRVSSLSSVEFTANANLPGNKASKISQFEWQAMSDIERSTVQKDGQLQASEKEGGERTVVERKSVDMQVPWEHSVVQQSQCQDDQSEVNILTSMFSSWFAFALG
uniref:Uncharacterized protein n=1 Tax=Parascaris equorum TaxID=6256 RepID=A0A914S3I4_PAREQ